MAAKLRLITKQIHWSLVIKAILLAVAWLSLPLWAFFLLALFFYLFPFFRGITFAPFFLLFIFLATVWPLHFGIALLLGATFYLLLGIKDLLLIDRQVAYQGLTFIFFFLALFAFFEILGTGGITVASLLWSFTLGVLFVYFVLGYEEYLKERGTERRRNILIAGIGGLLLWELITLLLVLPIDVLPASALSFLAAASMFEFISQGLYGTATRKSALVVFSTFFTLSTILLASLSWKF